MALTVTIGTQELIVALREDPEGFARLLAMLPNTLTLSDAKAIGAAMGENHSEHERASARLMLRGLIRFIPE